MRPLTASWRVGSAATLSLLAMLLLPGIATAASAGAGGQGFEISPPKYELSANPGQTLTTTINLRNITTLPITTSAVFNDFTAQNETGNPGILADGSEASSTSMKSWFLPVAPITLEPGRLTAVTVRLRVPANASPGGHYGVVRFNSGTGSTGGSSGVALSASVGTLYLVTVSGQIRENLTTEMFTVSKDDKVGSFFQKGPVTFTELFKNSGNVFVKPTGSIVVTDTFGKKVGQIDVNKNGGNVLQDSKRKFQQSFNGKLLGRYTASLYASYGSGKQLEVSKVTFWVVPWALIAIVIAVLAVLALLLTRFRIEPRKRKKKAR